MRNKTVLLPQALILSVIIMLVGCTTTAPLKGVTPEGDKAYIGATPIDNTQAYQTFLQSPRSELDRIQYLLNRIKAATRVKYDRNGTVYNSEETYKTGLWLVGNRYIQSQDAITFLRDHVWYAKPSLRPHLALLPDGSVHVAYYLFLNELALLDATIQN